MSHEKFEGPLDFLLAEIEKEKLSINEVSLARITESFLAHIKSLPADVQQEISEFIVIAAQLLLIKSRSLLPQLPLSEEEELSIEELENRLKLLQKIRLRAEDLLSVEKGRRTLFAREGMLGVPVIFYPPKDLTLNDCAELFREILAAIPKQEKLPEDKLKKIISLEEKIRELQISLQERAERLFSDIVKGSSDKIDIIVNFLAILELARKKVIDLQQNEMFGDITIKRSETTVDGPDTIGSNG